MINITKPVITSDVPFDCWMSFMDTFISEITSLTLLINDAPTSVITSAGTFINTYQLSNTSKLLKAGSESYGFTYGTTSSAKYDGCVIQPSQLFIDTNYALLSTNYSTGYKAALSSHYFGMTFAAVDIDNNNGYGFGTAEQNSKQNALIFNKSIVTDMTNAVIHTYNTDDTAFISVYDTSNYIIFAKLKPIDPADGLLYVIITRIQNRDDKAVYFISKDQTYTGTPFAEPMYVISSGLQITDVISDEIVKDKFVYDDKWYSDNLYVVNNVSDDHVTVIDGEQYIPLGYNLFLKSK